MNFSNIKIGDFVLIHGLQNQKKNHFYWIIYVERIELTKLVFIDGTIVKSNVKNCLFTNYRHYPEYTNIIKVINNKNEIEELNLLYKLYLLKES